MKTNDIDLAAAVREGSPYPRGATWDGNGVNFALFSANATRVDLCLFDAEGRETDRIALPEYRDDLQYLRVWVSRVRRKLGAEPGEPGRIKTFQGIGYLLDVEPPQPPETPEPEPAKDEQSALIG